ncbi:hypothetical protein SBA3_910007 [Candidatus Sulfopaludibacter sp. SbA3]|nr:hypothetical protein SBA3_910007 [Candidatus Sulfopaludibacter sp. SbA3]
MLRFECLLAAEETLRSLIGEASVGFPSRVAPFRGFRDYWTIISKAGLNVEKLKSESPTTNDWFDVAQVLAREGDDWNLFKSRLADAGIPLD